MATLEIFKEGSQIHAGAIVTRAFQRACIEMIGLGRRERKAQYGNPNLTLEQCRQKDREHYANVMREHSCGNSEIYRKWDAMQKGAVL